MALSIAFLSGKGGVTKSTLARATSVAFVAAQWDTLLADLELGQATSRKWARRREEAGLTPAVPVQSFGAFSQAKKELASDAWDLVIFDCPAFASQTTKEIAEAVDLVVIPTRYSTDDMESTAEIANSLALAGIDPKKIAIVFSGVAEARATHERDRDREEAGEYFAELPYTVIPGYIPHQKALSTAQDEGRSIIECHYTGPRRKAEKVIQAIITRFEEITEE